MEVTGLGTQGSDEDSRPLARTVDQAGTEAHDAIKKVSYPARAAVDRFASGAYQAVNKIARAAGRGAETVGVKGEQLKNVQAEARW